MAGLDGASGMAGSGEGQEDYDIDKSARELGISMSADALPGTVPSAQSEQDAEQHAQSSSAATYSSEAISQTQRHEQEIGGAAPLAASDSLAVAMPTGAASIAVTGPSAASNRDQQDTKRKPMPLVHSKSLIFKQRMERDEKAWMRDRTAVDAALMRSRLILCVIGLTGTCFSVVQCELIFREGEPGSAVNNVLKFFNTITSLALLALLIRHYRLVELWNRIKMHLEALQQLDTHVPVETAFRKAAFWAEVLACLPHCPPFVTFEIVLYNWSNIVMYRAETFFCVINSMRVYLLWPVVRDKVLLSLPRRHTIAAFNRCELNGTFALKRILGGKVAIQFICLFWLLTIVLTGYWLRASEFNACLLSSASSPWCKEKAAKVWSLDSAFGLPFEKTNDLYLWNYMWGAFVTSTSVGYGDIIATTHTARMVLLFAAVTGLVCVAALTASFSVTLTWTDKEQAALLLIHREQSRRQLRLTAITLLQCWAKTRLTQNAEAKATLFARMWRLRQQFHRLNIAHKHAHAHASDALLNPNTQTGCMLQEKRESTNVRDKRPSLTTSLSA